jgi:hypothetical protein
MFNSFSNVTTTRVHAVDGDVGPVMDVLFDDRDWVMRYLVVDAGTWLAEREVLISPYSIKQPVGRDGLIDVALTRRLVRASPALDIDQPVSRQQEQEFRRHYHYPAYWDGGGLWALGALPYPSIAPHPDAAHGALADQQAVDMQLRSAEQVCGYEVLGADQGIGVVEDFIFDDESWQIRYLVVDMQGEPPDARRVLIGRPWVERIDWAGQRIHLAMTREQAGHGPTEQDLAAIHRGDEVLRHANHWRPGPGNAASGAPVVSLPLPKAWP